jgi:predicted enzyme related to lactoylglutathione lyase
MLSRLGLAVHADRRGCPLTSLPDRGETAPMSKGVDVFQIEIRVNDLAAAMTFYRETFQWGVFQTASHYALVDAGHMPVIGIMMDPRLPNGVAPLYLVGDCEMAVNRAKELGGRVMFTKTEVPGAGAFTAALDPWGNEIYFWQQNIHGDPKLKQQPATPFCYVEIATPNLAKTTEYYSQLMAWSFWNVPFAEDYAVAEGHGMKRGIGVFGGASSSGVLSYIEVASLEETRKKILANGGQVVVDPEPFLNEGRYLIFSDPAGNRLGAIERNK